MRLENVFPLWVRSIATRPAASPAITSPPPAKRTVGDGSEVIGPPNENPAGLIAPIKVAFGIAIRLSAS